MCLSIAVDRPENVLSKGEHVGFEWMTVHNGIGYRCGYVRVPAGHPWHGKHYDDLPIDVHGGLTFAEPDKPCDKDGSDNAWWFGFDCAHAGDAPDPCLPHEHQMMPIFSDSIKTQEYVESECRSLCEQVLRRR